MKMTKILAISTFGILLSACDANQMQSEASAPDVVTGKSGPAHIHNVEGFGDFTHSHLGNSTAGHGHTWEFIQNEIKKRSMQ